MNFSFRVPCSIPFYGTFETGTAHCSVAGMQEGLEGEFVKQVQRTPILPRVVRDARSTCLPSKLPRLPAPRSHMRGCSPGAV